MTAVASSLINWSALWKIALVALIGGCGVVIAFGFALLGLRRASTALSSGVRRTYYALAVASSLFCTAALLAGIYAMATKPSATTAPEPSPAPIQHSAPRHTTPPSAPAAASEDRREVTSHPQKGASRPSVRSECCPEGYEALAGIELAPVSLRLSLASGSGHVGGASAPAAAGFLSASPGDLGSCCSTPARQ